MYSFGDLKMNGVKATNKAAMCSGIYKGHAKEGCYNTNV